MKPEELDHLITIQRATYTTNSFNELIEDWENPEWQRTVSAARKDASGSERYRAMEVGAQITTRFTIRWSPFLADVNPKDRVLFDGRVYNITAVRDVDRRRWREIDAVARSD